MAMVVLAGLCGCDGKFTEGSSDGGFLITAPGGSSSTGSGSSSGCAGTSIPNALVIDSCDGDTTTQAALFTVKASCNVEIDFTGATQPCTGTLTGSTDAFNGFCGGLACNATSLPGNIVCTQTSTTCTIKVCSGAGGC